MNHFKKLQNQVTNHLVFILILNNVFVGALAWLLFVKFDLPLVMSVVALGITGVLLSLFFGVTTSKLVLEPLQFLWQAILHVSPQHGDTPAPNLEHARFGRELVTALTLQVYQFASQQDSKDLIEHRKQMIQSSNIVSHMPLPLFVFNRTQVVTNASDSAMEYCQKESSELFGKPLYESVNFEFPSDQTLEKWLVECQDVKVTDTAYWERVRVQLKEGMIKQCDIAAYYNRDNPSGTEFIVTLFDRTAQYNQDDQAMSFVALAVHELRTPLTMLRGYIEVFQDELSGKLDDELTGFMHKMEAAASQLTAFVNNILNVSRIESNQFALQLNEESWEQTLKNACEDAEMRAKVHDIKLEYHIAEGLPTIAVDRISIFEVVNNLLENAIKYSPGGKRIVISSKLDENDMLETTIQDFGVGVPNNVLPNLFEKFYRNHRTKSEVGGTGLGLFLCKSIIDAHGGQIWAKSKEGSGSTFGFTLQPYAQLADELKNGNNKDIVRSAHGWIKNHSLYRR